MIYIQGRNITLFILPVILVVLWIPHNRLTPNQLIEIKSLLDVAENDRYYIKTFFDHTYDKTISNRTKHIRWFKPNILDSGEDSLIKDIVLFKDNIDKLSNTIDKLRLELNKIVLFDSRSDIFYPKQQGSIDNSFKNHEIIKKIRNQIDSLQIFLIYFQKKYTPTKKIIAMDILSNDAGISFEEYHFENSPIILILMSLCQIESGIYNTSEKILIELENNLGLQIPARFKIAYDVELLPSKDNWKVGETFKAKILIRHHFLPDYEFIEFYSTDKNKSNFINLIPRKVINGVFKIDFPLTYNLNVLLMKYSIRIPYSLDKYKTLSGEEEHKIRLIKDTNQEKNSGK